MSEILAPCGGVEGIKAALNTGADAIYVGMKSFSARKNAANFTEDELRDACCECHKRGVRLYAALNTLVYDDELEQLADCIRTAVECGADGLILQDLGAAALAENIAPRLRRHASTQMTLNSVSGVAAAKRLGYSRVVLGRELSFEQILKIAESTDTELEVFVHGALCVSVSGQCYMSSVFGGRSGNRGLCAQPCRLDFTCGECHNVISLKDSSLIDHLRELERAGISSFKIEGRMKRPEYAACAVDACRRSLCGEEYDRERLGGIFSRSGLTDGYFSGSMENMQGIRSKDDVDNSAKALSGIKALYKDEFPRLRVDIHTQVLGGKPITAHASCGDISLSVSGDIPQKANNAPTTSDDICRRMAKLGGTQFLAGRITAEADDGLYIPAASLNALRRELCEALSEEILRKNTPRYDIRTPDLPAPAKERVHEIRYRAEVHSAAQLRQALSLPFEIIYAPMGLVDGELCEGFGDRLAVVPPLFLADCEDEVRLRLTELRRFGCTVGLAQTLGSAQLLRECGFEVCGGYRMNILNSLSAKVCADFGFRDITLSLEGTAERLAKISADIPVGILAYGHIPLMTMRRCPIADGKPCGRVSPLSGGSPCGGFLKDRRGTRMDVLCGGNSVELLNPDTLVLSDRQHTLKQFDFAVLKFTVEEDIKPIFDMYLNNGKPSGSLTRGLYFRGAE